MDRRIKPATHTEWHLRRYPPSNFVHGRGANALGEGI